MQHPGGEEVFLASAGQDATECFDTIGHTNEAKSLMKSFKIGELINVGYIKIIITVMKYKKN